jgi:hypothetical protein
MYKYWDFVFPFEIQRILAKTLKILNKVTIILGQVGAIRVIRPSFPEVAEFILKGLKSLGWAWQ